MRNLIIATRKSALALWQSEFVKENLLKLYPSLNISLESFKTKGDVMLETPLAKIGGKGLFTKELELAMLERRADLAVHSLKDMPSELPQGLVLAAVMKRHAIHDSLLSENYKDLKALPKGAKVGTTSLRRKMQLLAMRSDLEIISLRGNVNSRIQKLKNGDFDAIILARAGIERLNLDKEVKFIYDFTLDEMIPAASQGALGIESIKENELLELLERLNDEKARIETHIERQFIATLEGSCGVPIGVNASLKDENIELRAILGLPDASEILQEKSIIKKNEYQNAGLNFAQMFISKGAKELLEKAKAMLE